MKNKIIIKVLAYVLLFAITFGYAIIGMVTFPRYNVEFKGSTYKSTENNDVFIIKKNIIYI